MCLLLIGLMGVPALTSEALHVSQEEFVDNYKQGETELVLMGAGLKRFLVFKMVAVGLYLQEGILEENILTNVPRRIEVAYLQNVSKKELIKETLKGIQANLNAEQFEEVKSRVNQLHEWYVDVEPEDRYAFTYIPDVGTQVDLNGVKQGIIEGEDFAFAFFSMYIGAKPSDNRVKQKLLGRIEYYQ